MILTTNLTFYLSLELLIFINRDFPHLPPSPEIIIEMTLPKKASLKVSQPMIEQFSVILAKENNF
ncbi:MAG: hypothetical protein AMR96_01630 [Candidatus Adiutrix intracellularis]|nr:MAG: hypothetical protein AMR96_01630 [Candidatus Adiutrix intracellularis]